MLRAPGHLRLAAAAAASASSGADFARQRRRPEAATAEAQPASAATESPRTSRACFGILGLEPASQVGQYCHDDIKVAYRRAARTAHPDVPGGSEHRFRHVQIAYEYLKPQPGIVASDAEVLDAEGKPAAGASGGSGGGAGRGFYAHPHNSHYERGTPGQGRPRTQHTTRTRYSEAEGRGVYEDPDPSGAFVKFAKAWGEAMQQGRGNEFLREHRAKQSADWARAAEEERERQASMDEHTRRYEQSRRQYNAFFWTTRAIKYGTIGALGCAMVASMQKYLAFHKSAHHGSAYSEEFLKSLEAIPTAASKVDGRMYGTLAERDVADYNALTDRSHNMRGIAKKVTSDPLNDGKRSVALTFRGKPFTTEGVAATKARPPANTRPAAGTEADLATATAAVTATATSNDDAPAPSPKKAAPAAGPSPPHLGGPSAPVMSMEALSAASHAMARQAALTTVASAVAIQAEAAGLGSANVGEDGGDLCMDD